VRDNILYFFIGLISGALPGMILIIIKSTSVQKLNKNKTQILKKLLWGDQDGE
jgi:hypothetical protein